MFILGRYASLRMYSHPGMCIVECDHCITSPMIVYTKNAHGMQTVFACDSCHSEHAVI